MGRRRSETLTLTQIVDTWLYDGGYVERWEQGFRKRLYHGRTGGYFKSDLVAKKPFDEWVLPVFTTNTLEDAPWNNALRMRNTQDGVTVDPLYMAFPKALARGVIAFEALLPTAAKTNNGMHVGFEVNSGGAFAFIASFCTMQDIWQLVAGDYRHPYRLFNYLKSGAITLNYPDAWAKYALRYDYPYLTLWQSTVADVHLLEYVATLDMVHIQGKGIPFLCNEQPDNVCEFRVGNMWVYETLPQPIERIQSWTNPGSNPSLTINTGGRKNVELWARSISAGTTVLVQASQDGTTWRDIEELTTALLNGINQVHKGYYNAYRYVKVTIEETGTGTEIIELTASQD